MNVLWFIAGMVALYAGRFLYFRIRAKEAKRLIADEGATLVDVRTPAEYASGHIDGARNIPVQEIAARSKELPKGKPVVVYCASGMRSAVAASSLRRAGFDKVVNAGPMSAWG
jgi:phage shock protein E